MSGQHRADVRPKHDFVWRSVEVHRQISIALVLAAPSVSFLMSRVEKTKWVVLLLGAQLAVAAATWLLGEGRAKRLQHERLTGRQDTLLVIGHALDPLLTELARAAGLPKAERRIQRTGLVQLALSVATSLGEEDAYPRACYFRIVNDEGSRRLVHETSVGRAVQAKAEFRAGTIAGDAALEMIDGGGDLFCDDVSENPPPGWVPSERGEYRTFISVTVRSGAVPHGMLTLDATKAGALTAEDAKMLRALGHVLGTVETLAA